MFFFKKKKKPVETAVVETKKEEPIVVAPKVEEKAVKPKAETNNAPKAAVKKAVKKEEKKEETPVENKKLKAPRTPTYHITKREDGKWQVKGSGLQKASKLFDTQKEAIAYSKQLSENTERGYVIHKSDGKIRKKSYETKVKQ